MTSQFTLIRDTDDQFLLTVGLSWEAPSGSKEIFQGSPPAYLAPYLTVGKEFGNFHFLATTGYNFPAESAVFTTNSYYANFHLDRRFGWFYPLIEFNGTWTNWVEADITDSGTTSPASASLFVDSLAAGQTVGAGTVTTADPSSGNIALLANYIASAFAASNTYGAVSRPRSAARRIISTSMW